VRAQGALMQGREAARRLAWSDAYTALSLADSSSPLAAQDLELLATAALLLGHVEDGRREGAFLLLSGCTAGDAATTIPAAWPSAAR
jgi:hypothetical protein